ncbi:hypothetical protein B0G74_1130 [Paraburkholderia sp. BL9I2N2]|nr:hypothetical protein B0G74_1130 [Paraburkholderia sp. BL9I2N2]
MDRWHYFLMILGPLALSDEVTAQMQFDMGSRDRSFKNITASVRKLMIELIDGNDTHSVVPIQGSGSYGMEAALATFVCPSDRPLVCINGIYGEQILELRGVQAVSMKTPSDQPLSATDIAAHLGQDPTITQALVQIGGLWEVCVIERTPYQEDGTASQTAGAAVPLRPRFARLNWPLGIRWTNSIPERVIAAFLKRLKPSMTFVRDSMLPWSCSTKLLRYFEDRTFVSSGQQAIDLHLAHGAVRGCTTIKRDGIRSLALMFDCLAEKGSCRLHVALGAEHEVYCLAHPIHHSIKIDQLAAQLEVSLVDTPRLPCGPAKAVRPFYELRRKAPHPAQDRRVRQRQTPFRHHLDQFAQARLVAQVPANTQNDHVAVKVTACDQFVKALQLANRRFSICSA